MPTAFEIRGPFRVPVTGPARSRVPIFDRDWWESSAELRRLATAKGCYVFFRRVGRADLPIYVGMTHGAKGFRTECFADHKFKLLVKGMLGKTGTLYLTLVERVVRRGRSSKEPTTELEKFLIAAALLSNPKGLMNTRSTRTNVPKWEIRGVSNPGPGAPSRQVQQFKRMM